MILDVGSPDGAFGAQRGCVFWLWSFMSFQDYWAHRMASSTSLDELRKDCCVMPRMVDDPQVIHFIQLIWVEDQSGGSA